MRFDTTLQNPGISLCRAFLLGGVSSWWLIASGANGEPTSNLEGSRVAATDTADVPWLADVQRPPSASVGEDVHLRPLLLGKNGTRIQTRAKWEVERARLRQRWLDFLGPMPNERAPVCVKVLQEDTLSGGCTRQLVQYNGELNQPVEGYILRPPSESALTKRPGIVAFHPTADENMHEMAGVRGRPGRDIGVQLARQGFIVFCPQCFLWQDARSLTDAADRFKKAHPATLGMHKMLWDGMRAVDVLEKMTDVDANRIGGIGHSLGAKEVLYLLAFDDRVRAAVASEGGIGLSFSNWDAPWYLGDSIHAKSFGLNHHELLALAAPRPFLILAGESGLGAADGDRTWPYIEAAMPVYRLYRSRAPLGLYNHRQGHNVPHVAFERMVDWLKTYLRE